MLVSKIKTLIHWGCSDALPWIIFAAFPFFLYWMWKRRRPEAKMPLVRIRVGEAMALFALITLECSVVLPSLAYFRNANEFRLAYIEFACPMSCVFLCLLALQLGIVWMLRARPDALKGLVFAMAIVGLGVWLQSNFRAAPVYALTGGIIRWTNAKDVTLDAFLWIGVVATLYLFRGFLFNRMASGLVILFLFQACVFGWSYNTVDSRTEALKFKVAHENDLFSFSRKRNVILLLLDGFQGTIFNKYVNGNRAPAPLPSSVDSTLEAKGKPWRDMLDGFTYFQNATSMFMSTLYSIPNLLTATAYDNTVSYRSYIAEISKTHNLFAVLQKAGVSVSASADSEWIFSGQLLPTSDGERRPIDFRGAVHDLPLLYDLALFKAAPYLFKRFVYGGGRWFFMYAYQTLTPESVGSLFPVPAGSKASDIEFLNDFNVRARADRDQPTFKFIHLRSPHPPFDLTEDFHTQAAPDLSQPRFEMSAQAALHIAQVFLTLLKSKGLYDNSLILIVSDHGLGYPAFPSNQSLRDGDRWSPQLITSFDFIKGRLLPLMLMKKVNERGPWRLSQAPVTLGDVPQTIVDGLNVNADFSGEGHVYKTLNQAHENDQRVRYSRYYEQPVPPDLYVTPEAEFRIEGHSWDDASWHFTHRAFVKQRGLVRLASNDIVKANFWKTLESNATQYYETP